MATDNLNGGNSSTSGNSDSVLKDSPWGRLSEVTSLNNVSNGFASATGSQSGGAANSSSDSPYGGNPFANFGNPDASSNVFTGGTNPWASLNNSGGSGNTGSSPVASGDTSGGSTSNSGGSDFGGIDFASAIKSVSFQDRVQTDQLVNSSLSQNGVSVPTSNLGSASSNPSDPSFDPLSSGSNSSGNSPVGSSQINSSNSGGVSSVDGSNSGGVSSVDGSNSGGVSPVGGSNGDSVPQVSPFDQLQQNLNDYFQPFSNGGTPDASQFGDPGKINPFNANLNSSSSSVNGGISADDTRNSLLGSIDTTNTDTLGSQIEDKVVSLANSSNGTQTVSSGTPTIGGGTPTVNGNAVNAVNDTPTGNDNVFPQLASDNGSNLAQTSPIADTSNQLVDGSSTNAGDNNPSLDDFNKFLSAAQSGDDSLIGSSIPDGTPLFVADAIKDNASTIANTIG
ncbi:MAG: hypothetical protein PUP92_38830, partial [Rhizonema sp. PD38]|nr:hypothetical protein [Rhizonema sp. PD38]